MQYHIPANNSAQKKRESVNPSALYISLNTNREERTRLPFSGLFSFQNIPANKSVNVGEWIGKALAAGYIDLTPLTNVSGATSIIADGAAGTAKVPSGATYTWTDSDGGTHLMIKN